MSLNDLEDREEAMLRRFAARYDCELTDDELEQFDEQDRAYEAAVNSAWHAEIIRSGRTVSAVLAELDAQSRHGPDRAFAE